MNTKKIEKKLLDIAKKKGTFPQGLIDKFQNELMPRYDEILVAMSIVDIIEFAEDILHTGQLYDIEPLVLFAQQMLEDAHGFKVIDITKNLTTFMRLANIIITN